MVSNVQHTKENDMTTKVHAAIALGFAVGGFAIFNGYATLAEGQVEILQADDPVRIEMLEGEDELVVVKVDDEGNPILDAGGNPAHVERCFAEELTPASVEGEEEVEVEEVAEVISEGEAKALAEAAPVEAAPATAKKTTAKPAAAATDAVKPETAAAKKKRETTERKETAAKAKAEAAKALKDTANKAKADLKKTKADAEKAAKIVATPVVSIIDAGSVTAAIAESDALTAALSLVNRAEQTDFTLGGVIRIIKETGVFKTLGFDGPKGFDEYVETTLGIDKRKASYLMKNYVTFVMIGVDEARLAEIGWSKVKELARIDPVSLKKNFDALVDFSKENTREALVAHIKTNYVVATRAAGEKVKMTTFTFKVAEDSADAVSAALKASCAAAGTQDLNDGFVYLCTDWSSTAPASDMTLDDMIDLMATKFGLTSVTVGMPDGTEQTSEFTEATEEEIAAAATA